VLLDGCFPDADVKRSRYGGLVDKVFVPVVACRRRARGATVKYGVKINPKEMGDSSWREALGDPARFLGRLREYGVGFVEFTWTEDMNYSAIATIGRRAWQEGLSSSIHPYLYGDLAVEVFDARSAQGLAGIFELAEALGASSGVCVPLVFHGGRADCDPHNRTLEQATAAAREFFRWADRATKQTYPNVRVFCETQMPVFPEDGAWTRVGDTYATCLELVEATDVEVCWDFGHGFGSFLLGKHGEFPGQEFLARVGHVHAHDTVMTESGAYDHRPLGKGFCPWRRYFQLLAEQGFAGNILFEVALKRPDGYHGLRAMLDYSIGEVEAIFAGC